MNVLSPSRTASVNIDLSVQEQSNLPIALHHADRRRIEGNPGTRIVRCDRSFSPVLFVETERPDGGFRTYIVDQDGCELGRSLDDLPDAVVKRLQAVVQSSNHQPTGYRQQDGSLLTVHRDFAADLRFVTLLSLAEGIVLSSEDGEITRVHNAFGDSVGPLEPGWGVRFLFVGLAPLHLLELVHADGRQATWYLGDDGTFFSHELDVVPEALRRRVGLLGAQFLAADTDATRLLLRGFSFLAPQTRTALRELFPSLPSLRRRGTTQPDTRGNGLSHPALVRLPAPQFAFAESVALSSEHLREGWRYRADQWWAWGTRSVLSFHLEGYRGPALLRLELQAGTTKRVVAFSINGWAIAECTVDPDRGQLARRDVWLPAEALVSGENRLEMQSEAGSDPYGFGLRRLALKTGQVRPDVGTPTPDRLMAQFENLGDNCEFGLVQRTLGAEPMGLMRFADCGDLFNVTRLIESGFEGLGNPGSLSTQIIRTFARQQSGQFEDKEEFYVADTAQGYGFHTWKGPADHSEADAIEEAEQKLAYLRGKMLERLKSGSRIWVVKRTRQTGLHEILSLHAALRSHGPNTLFWVRSMRPGRPAGAVEWIHDGLICGYSDQDHAYPHLYDTDRWLALCARAYEQVRQAQDSRS